MSGTITITTTNEALFDAFFDLKLEGVKAVMPLRKNHKDGKRIYEIIVHIASEVAIGLFVAWLWGKTQHHLEGETKIESQPIAHDRAQITAIIGEKVIINNYYGEENPDDVAITEETP